MISWSPIHERFFHRNSNSMEMPFCSRPKCNQVTAIRFCTWRDSCAVVVCTKFCKDIIPYNGVTLKTSFHQIWITTEQANSEGFDSCDWPCNLTQIGFKSSIFQPVWPRNLMDDLKKNRTPHLYYTKLCVSFQNHQWIQTGVTVRKRLIRVKIGDFFCPVWPWNFTDDLEKQ